MFTRRLSAVAVATAGAMLIGAPAALAFNSYAGTFSDDDGIVHEADIEAISADGITDGCNPPDNDEFCPSEDLTRGQMAKFLDRALELDDTDTDYFTDDDESKFESSINAMREARITDGCNPPENDEYCPEDDITRGQMAKFLVRGFDLPATETDYFTDDDDSQFEDDINALREAGVTFGCNPPENDEYCAEDTVTRAQMASFIARAKELKADDPTPFEGQTTCDPAYSPCVPTVEEFGDLDCDDITEEYPDGVKHDDAFGDPHDLNADDDDMACEPVVATP